MASTVSLGSTEKEPAIALTQVLKFAMEGKNPEEAKKLLTDNPKTLDVLLETTIECVKRDGDRFSNVLKTLLENQNATTQKKALGLALKKGTVVSMETVLRNLSCNAVEQREIIGITLQDAAYEFENVAETIQCLCEHPMCDVNYQDKQGLAAVQYVAWGGNPNNATVLLENDKCIVNLPDDDDKTAFYWAAYWAADDTIENRKQCLKIFANHPRVELTLDSYGDSALTCFLSMCGNKGNYLEDDYYTECVDILLSKQGMVNAAEHTLALAISRSSLDICKQLLAAGANVNSKFTHGETALHAAVKQDSFLKCKLLMDNNADVTMTWKGLTPLQLAIARGCNTQILELLSKPVNMDQIEIYLSKVSFSGESPLNCAIRLGMKPAIEYLSRKFDAMTPDKTGLRAVDLACKGNCENIEPIQSALGVLSASRRIQAMKKWYAYRSTWSTKIKKPNIQVERISGAQAQVSKSERKSYGAADLFYGAYAAICSKESKEVTKQVFSVVQKLSARLASKPSTSHLAFKPILAGGTSEGTKKYGPNELDIVCEFINISDIKLPRDITSQGIKVEEWSPWKVALHKNIMSQEEILDTVKVSEHFYGALEAEIQDLILENNGDDNMFGCLHLHSRPIVLRDKISFMQLLWRGHKFKDMVVYVDLVPAFPFRNHTMDLPDALKPYMGSGQKQFHHIAKSDRLFCESTLRGNFKVSTSCIEKSIIRSVPVNLRHGYLFAKALRNGSICQPKNIEDLRLVESISSEDVITSFILKVCLILSVTECQTKGNEIEWAERIYDKLDECLQNGKIPNYEKGGGASVFSCDGARVQRECCLKKKIMISVCSSIREWLKDNKSELMRLASGRHIVYARVSPSKQIFKEKLEYLLDCI